MPRYTFIWRNEWLTIDAKTLEEMIADLKGGVVMFTKLQKTGKVTLEVDTEEDYFTLVTHDPAVAKKFGFNLAEEGGEKE